MKNVLRTASTLDEHQPLHEPDGNGRTVVNQGHLSAHQSLQCQLVVAVVQISFVVGSVYLKQSVKEVQGPPFHPTIFAFAREAIAGPILCVFAYFTTWESPKSNMLGLLGLGLCLFLNQLFFILGVNLAGVFMATAMQPFIPVVTACLSVLLGFEMATAAKLVGILAAVGGTQCMVMGGVRKSPAGSVAAGGSEFLGITCLVINTHAMGVYYVLAKRLLLKYSPVCIAAWAYIVAATFMGITAVVTIPSHEWHVPPAMYGALMYWVFIASIAGYAALTWACSRLPASQVAAFQSLQPCFGYVLGVMYLKERSSIWDFGGLGILGGLLILVREGSGPKEDGH